MPFNDTAKAKLSKMGIQANFIIKDEYGIRLNGFKRPIAFVDHVWLGKIPDFNNQLREFPIVSFEISKDLAQVWNRKKMIGDIENLRLSGCSLGVLVIPDTTELVKQEKMGNNHAPWVTNTMPGFMQALRATVGSTFRLEIWQFDQEQQKFALMP